MTLRRTYIRRGLLAIIVLAVAGQVFQPAKTNPPVDPARTIQSHVSVPVDVQRVFDRSCRDCHSNETVWPWYASVSPMSWLVVGHVNEGREHLNLSEWVPSGHHAPSELLEHMCEEVKEGEMPLTSYTLLHPTAQLSDDEARRICAWTDVARAGLGGAGETPASAPAR